MELDSNLKVYKNNSGGNWIVKKYADGWHELFIRLMLPHANTTAAIIKVNLPAGIALKESRMQVTPALNGWNIDTFYHNNDEQKDAAAISSIAVVFYPKTAQSLTYHFDVCISGFYV